MIEKIGYILIVISLFCICYSVISNKTAAKIQGNIDNLVGAVNNKYEKRLLELKENAYIKKGKKKRLKYFDDIIRKSKIREKIYFFTGEFLIATCLILGVIAFLLVEKITINPFLWVEAAILGVMLPILILEHLSVKVFNSIDDNVLFFIDTCINYSKSKNDLTYILENTAEHLNGDIKIIVTQLVRELQKGIPSSVAFSNLYERVENIRLKQLFRNLYIASREDSDYKGVLEKAREVHEKYYEQKNDAKVKIKSGKQAMVMLIVVTAVIVKSLIGISPNAVYNLENLRFGQLVAAYFGAVGLLTVYKYFALSKFNF